MSRVEVINTICIIHDDCTSCSLASENKYDQCSDLVVFTGIPAIDIISHASQELLHESQQSPSCCAHFFIISVVITQRQTGAQMKKSRHRDYGVFCL